MRSTTSLCPVCYAVIPAVIVVDGSAVMTKTCPEHGAFTSVVEPDGAFYKAIRSLEKQSIYDGLLVDITGRCNLACSVCLHANDSEHIDADTVIKHCEDNADKAPFFLSGGEPTLHPDLHRIVRGARQFGGVGVITNGLKLTDTDYLQSLADVFNTDTLPIAFSVHPEIEIKQWVINNFRIIGKKLSSVFWVITSLDEIPGILAFYQKNRDVICQIRIKAATNVWKTQNVGHKLFVSDILNYLRRVNTVEIDTNQGNKTTAINCVVDGLPMMIVSWYDKYNIDLEDINCPPYYKGRDGIIRDFLLASILNEVEK